MSAADWRRAMNAQAVAAVPAARRDRLAPRLAAAGPAGSGAAPAPALSPSWAARIGARIGARHVVVLAAAILYPFVASPFFTYQIGAQSLALGLIALSLTFLGGYGGMVSLAQMTIAGVAGYGVAILGTSSVATVSLGWPWPVAVAIALASATVLAAAIGWLSVRTEGIYTIMITLAIGVAFFYLAQQNYTVFNGFSGFSKIAAPELFGVDWREPVPFYFLALATALAGYGFVRHLVRAPFGVALQGIRDNPRRMASLGFHVTAHRVAAYAVAGFLAAVGGVLMAWYNGRISPGTINLAQMIAILIIAVLGGMKHPIGAFIGAIVYVLLQNFAIDLVVRERFNLVIGGVFLAIVLFSPDGLLGLWAMLRSRLGRPLLAHSQRRQP